MAKPKKASKPSKKGDTFTSIGKRTGAAAVSIGKGIGKSLGRGLRGR